jgi:glycosyltransferase involved in cell wall biosynthesis
MRVTQPRTGAAEGVILALPNPISGQQGPVAAWVSAAGWANAARRVVGEAWIATPFGFVEPEEARQRASRPELSARSAPSWRRHIPTVAKTALKDVRMWREAARFQIDPNGPWRDRKVAFVWQRHELFQTAGLHLARVLKAPSVLFVPATLVWQSAQWSVRRPGWGRWLEHRAETPAFRAANLIACGSDAVAEQVLRCGASDDQILVTPTGVDVDFFMSHADPEPLRERLGLTGRFVIGWVGSFRSFHALDQAVEAAVRVESSALLMIGDGPERTRIEELARRRGVRAVFTGTVPHGDLPRYLALMDAAILVASADRVFHYSPLKVAEYLAAGLPVVAPRVGQLVERLTHGVDAVLVAPGDTDALAATLRGLRDDPTLRARLSRAARSAARERWSWDDQVRRVLTALESRRPARAGGTG